MPAFPRTHRPAQVPWPRGVSPLQNVTQSNKTETRPVGRRGVSWTEDWPGLDTTDTTVRAFLADIDRWHELGTEVTLVPVSHETAGGTAAQGSAGAVNGASQTGTSLVTDGWGASVTFKAGDYLAIAGVKGMRRITADTAADGSGNATFAIHPQLVAGSSPADDAVVTLNGPVTAKIHDAPVMPASWEQTSIYIGLSVTFRESV